MTGPRSPFSKYRASNVETGSVGRHMIYTEAQTLEEALNILVAKKGKRSTSKGSHRNRRFVDRELDTPRPAVTLPTLKFMEKK